MNKLKLLLKPSLLSLFGINKAKHDSNPKSKKSAGGRILLMIVVVIACLNAVWVYSSGMGFALNEAGQLELLLPLFMIVCAAASFMTTLFRSGGTLYAFRDYDLVMSLPVPRSTVAASRLLMLYGYNMVITLVVMLPAMVSYLTYGASTGSVWLTFVVTLPFLPVIPMVLASALGTVITWISAHFRKSSLLHTVLLFVVMIAVIALSSASGAMESQFAEIGSGLVHSVERVYLPVAWYHAALRGEWGLLLLFVLASLMLAAAFCVVIGRCFTALHTRLEGIAPKTKSADLSAAHGQSVFSALLTKERRRYFSSPLWVTNTAFGLGLLLLSSILLLFLPPDSLSAMMGEPELAGVIRTAAPFMVALLMSTVSIAGSSVSLEGRAFWILRTCPISGAMVCRVKVLWNMIVIAVPLAPSVILLTISLGFSWLEGVWMLILGLAYGLLTAELGLLFNLISPKLDWKNEATVVKQSFSCMGPTLIGLVLTLAPIILIGLVPQSTLLFSLLFGGVVVLADAVLAVILLRNGERLMDRICLV